MLIALHRNTLHCSADTAMLTLCFMDLSSFLLLAVVERLSGFYVCFIVAVQGNIRHVCVFVCECVC